MSTDGRKVTESLPGPRQKLPKVTQSSHNPPSPSSRETEKVNVGVHIHS